MTEEKSSPIEIPVAPPLPFFLEGEKGIVSFGKYSNLSFNELLHEDKREYVDWLITQHWLPNKSPSLFEFLCSAGRIPLNYVSEKKITFIPSPAQLKARYVDNDQLLNIVRGILGWKHDIQILDKFFEDSGFDIRVEIEQNTGGWGGKKKFSLYLNLVPVLQDDCFQILRLMNKHEKKIKELYPICALVMIEYRGSVNLDIVRKMYRSIEIIETTPTIEM